MKKSILIIGAGPGLSRGVAEKFAREGFAISLISRDAAKLKELSDQLRAEGIVTSIATADAGDAKQLSLAITDLATQAGGFDVVHYNAAVLKAKDIMEETSASLTEEFTVNVANALHSLQVAHPGLKKKQGAFLLTGGGLGDTPSPDYGSLSLGKAGIRSLAYQLYERLKVDGIYVGLLTVAGFINLQSATHSPAILADLFWKLYQERSVAEIYQ